ncbi:MAG TPA: hypothetical protein VKP61_08765 [Candidatus Acidoferrum sp.]|nr:hypothetical protein [Candidatus Acidoferrum sp.]
MQIQAVNIRELENYIHWLLALSVVNLLFTLAVADRVRRLAKKLKGN